MLEIDDFGLPAGAESATDARRAPRPDGSPVADFQLASSSPVTRHSCVPRNKWAIDANEGQVHDAEGSALRATATLAAFHWARPERPSMDLQQGYRRFLVSGAGRDSGPNPF